MLLFNILNDFIVDLIRARQPPIGAHPFFSFVLGRVLANRKLQSLAERKERRSYNNNNNNNCNTHTGRQTDKGGKKKPLASGILLLLIYVFLLFLSAPLPLCLVTPEGMYRSGGGGGVDGVQCSNNNREKKNQNNNNNNNKPFFFPSYVRWVDGRVCVLRWTDDGGFLIFHVCVYVCVYVAVNHVEM